MKANRESNCNDGVTEFSLKNIPCELMNWFRQHSSDNYRAVTSEIIMAMEQYKNLHSITLKDTK